MKYLTIPALLLIAACQSTITDVEWQVILKTDKAGNAINGTKEDLLNAVRQGADIKVGWGHRGKTRTIEHLSSPIWIGLIDGQEVIVHLSPQILSSIDWDNLNSTYEGSDTLNQEWRVVISTKGTFDAVWIDRITSEVIDRRPQHHRITWFVKGYDRENQVDPLFE